MLDTGLEHLQELYQRQLTERDPLVPTRTANWILTIRYLYFQNNVYDCNNLHFCTRKIQSTSPWNVLYPTELLSLKFWVLSLMCVIILLQNTVTGRRTWGIKIHSTHHEGLFNLVEVFPSRIVVNGITNFLFLWLGTSEKCNYVRVNSLNKIREASKQMKTTPIDKKDIQQVNINTHPAISGKSNIFFSKFLFIQPIALSLVMRHSHVSFHMRGSVLIRWDLLLYACTVCINSGV